MRASPEVIFNARPYLIAHGKAPRGRGSWAFRLVGFTPDEPVWVYGNVLFGEACREIMRRVKAGDFGRAPALVEVEVLS